MRKNKPGTLYTAHAVGELHAGGGKGRGGEGLHHTITQWSSSSSLGLQSGSQLLCRTLGRLEGKEEEKQSGWEGSRHNVKNGHTIQYVAHLLILKTEYEK